jgi:hypothetical protein
MAGRTLTVYLAADTDKFRREMNQAQREMNGFSGAIGGLAGSMKNMLGPALIGAGAALGVFAGKFAVDGIKAAAENEAAMAKLTQQLNLLGLAADATRIESFIDTLSRASGVADNELFPSFTNLVRITSDTDQAMSLLTLSMDVAAGTGKPLESVVQAIGKAAAGTFGPLQRLAPELKNIGAEGATTEERLAILAGKFEGQYTTAANTYQGQVARLGVAFDELKESFGTGFLTALDDANTNTGDYAETIHGFEPLVSALGTRFGEMAAAIGTVTEFVIGARESFDDWYSSLDGFNKFVADVVIKTLYTLVNPINALIGSIQTAIDKFRELLSLMGQQTPAADNGQGTPGRPLPSTRSAARVTESAVGTAIYRVLANTDARNGYTPGAVLA